MRTSPHVFNMALPMNSLVFSKNTEFCAYSSPDGAIKLWETNSGSLKQQYVPSSHLSATCSCISWGPKRPEGSPKKRKKKRKSQVHEAVENLDLIALGTTSGALLLYSLTRGDLHTQLNHGHTNRVTDVCWHQSGDVLYSCSLDQHIVEWQISTATVKHKWEADKNGLHSLAPGPTEDQLLSAGRTIKLWDLVTRKVLRTFSGHSTEVIQLLPVPTYQDGGNGSSSVSSTYFLSAAANDRLIQAWQSSSKEKTSLASFSLPEEPLQMFISPHLHEQTILLGVTTKSGQVVIFEHMLNGRVKKPVVPNVTIQIAADTTDVPLPIPLLGACFSADLEPTLVFAHGNILKPTFEKALYQSLEKQTCLVRKDVSRIELQVESSASKVQTPGVSQDLTVLAPGLMAPSGPVTEGQPAKRKRRKSTSGEMTLDERLNAISIEKPAGSVPPKTDTLVTLLTQGLHSHDKKILNNVLQNPNSSVINNTVKKLQLPYIVPLVKELSKRLHGHASSGQTMAKWMKAVLMYHASYLISYPDLVETLGGVHQMMESRVSTFSRLSKLHGKLELMLTQITSHGSEGEEEEAAAASQPLMVYQDDSSDEDIMGEQTESGDEWDEEESSSEMEVGGEQEESEQSGEEEENMQQDSDSDTQT